VITVIDASAVGALVLPDEEGRFAAIAAETAGRDELIAPMHLPIETASLIRKAVRQERLAKAAMSTAVGVATAILDSVEPDDLLPIGPTLALAFEHGLSVYDAAYLELAIRRSAALLTGDGKLAQAAASLAVPLPFYTA